MKRANPTTLILNLRSVALQAIRPYSGELPGSVVSAILLVWACQLNSYEAVGMAMLRPCIQLGAALALLYQLWSLLPALTAAVIFGNFYLYQTKVDHSILSDLVPVFLYLQIRYKDAWLLLFLTSFYFFTAGFSKLYGGWLAIDTQAVYSYVFAFEGMGRGGGFAPAALEGLPPLVWEGMDYVTVVWELAWALLLFRPRIALPLIAFGVLFHNATYALMGIGFWRMYLVYALLFYTLIFSKERYN